MKRHVILSLFLASCIFVLKAQNGLRERVFVHTDKSCYLAGEDVRVKFYTTDTHYHPSPYSKVGYVEIVDTVRPQAQLKLALQQGSGWGSVKIPTNLPSGIYQLRGYTRYMRNESENIFFKKEIAIINTFTGTANDRIEQAAPGSIYPSVDRTPAPFSPQLTTDHPSYSRRDLVRLTIGQLPDTEIGDLTLSVVRDDALVAIPYVNMETWKKQTADTSNHFTGEWIAEYEGHIITGRIATSGGTISPGTHLTAELAFAGKDLRYMQGQTDEKGNVTFYTGDIYGKNELITMASSETGASYRIDILSPFYPDKPKELPLLKFYPEQKQKLLERSIGVQLQQIMVIDSTGQAAPLQSSYYRLQPSLSYDLDNYTRFNTMKETFTEFIQDVSVRKVGSERRLSVLKEGNGVYNAGNTLVTLDGVPIHNHEDILNYDPRSVKKIEIYKGRYGFGGKTFECMVAFTTHHGSLPGIQLNDQAQLVTYECPQLPAEYTTPEYGNETLRNSTLPDFRHTLYWNPSVQISGGKPAKLQFYTSDLSGKFKIVLEGFTRTGEIIYGENRFEVK